jgi:hypothetical protein
MPLREIRDANGAIWTIFAVTPSSAGRATGGVRAEFAAGWLCFHCGGERRRLPGIPSNWERLTDDALLALLPATAPAPTRGHGR